MEKIDKEKVFQLKSTVYGPVKSWRYGQSLGVDLLYFTSTCSFNCIYCQLGNIQNITTEIKEYVSTEKVVSDFKESLENISEPLDVIMFSGSGEPTLASNLGEVAAEIKRLVPQSKLAVLTNSVHLGDKKVQESLKDIDLVILKIDASNNDTLKKFNRVHESVTLESILEGIKDFKKSFKGEIEVQMMFMGINKNETEELASILNEIQPNNVQLNTPKRLYPLEWNRENRGNHLNIHDHETRALKTISKEEAIEIETTLRDLTGLDIQSIYR